ncbi:MAG TPA: zf-HC2 domain-containing protein [Armatimonadota bacterium]|jgi:hypothetical protein
MNCHSIQNKISAYVDGELPGIEMLSIRKHISACKECESELDSILLVKRSLSGLASEHSRIDLAARISEQIDRSGLTPESNLYHAFRKHVSGFSGGLRLVSVTAGLVLAMVMVGKSGTPTQPLVYNPPYASSLVSSFDEPDPIRVFYVPRTSHSGTLYIVPNSKSAPQGIELNGVPMQLSGTHANH